MAFAWDEINVDHIAKHLVNPSEAEYVVEMASPPFPQDAGDGRLLVWGPTQTGRFLQVVYVLKEQDELDFEAISMQEWATLGENETIIRVIHARDLTAGEKRQLTKRRR